MESGDRQRVCAGWQQTVKHEGRPLKQPFQASHGNRVV